MMNAGRLQRALLRGALLGGVSLATTGCCCALDFSEFEKALDEDRPVKSVAALDLGTAKFPKKSRDKPTVHPWWLRGMKPNKYELSYAIDEERSNHVQAAYHDWAKRVGHKRIDEDRFQWRPPRGCEGGLRCAYESLEQQGRASIEPVAELFRKRAKDADLSSLEVAQLVITFAQEIRYRIPKEEPFGVLAPALVVEKKNGDCDSKALLAHMILRSLGIRSLLVSSKAHKHTMLGVALPAQGTTFTHQGSRYAFVELTAKRSPIGHINPKLLRPMDWRAVPLRYDQGSGRTNRGKAKKAVRSTRIRIDQ